MRCALRCFASRATRPQSFRLVGVFFEVGVGVTWGWGVLHGGTCRSMDLIGVALCSKGQ